MLKKCDSELMTVAEVAERIHCSEAHLCNAIERQNDGEPVSEGKPPVSQAGRLVAVALDVDAGKTIGRKEDQHPEFFLKTCRLLPKTVWERSTTSERASAFCWPGHKAAHTLSTISKESKTMGVRSDPH